jgi:hypothetical protein
MPRIFLKYFMPYLSALLQRHAMHHIVNEACDIVRTLPTLPQIEAAKRTKLLRGHLLEFAVDGHFTHVSTREALHRYYRLCQEGLDVQHALDNARRAISDLDAQHTTAHHIQVAEDTAATVKVTTELQKDMQKHLRTVANVQRMTGRIEIFLVSVYAAHLWHMFADHGHRHLPWLESHLWGLPRWIWGIFFWALLAIGIMICLHIYHKRHSEDDTA